MQLTAAEIEAIGVAREVDANKRAMAAGFANAAEQEMDANRRSIAAGFTSAVDQEIDANRRARLAGFENAALQENPAAAAPGESIYSNKPFVDPRVVDPRVDLQGNNSYGDGSNPYFPQLVQNYTAPGLLNWSGIMPTGGMFSHADYQPWANIFDYQPPNISGYRQRGPNNERGYTAPDTGGDDGTNTINTDTAANTNPYDPTTSLPTMNPYLDSYLGNVGADKAGTLGGLLDVATGASVFTPQDYIQDKAQGLVRDYFIQNLVQETPALQNSLDILSTLNATPFTLSEPERDAAQRNIDNAVAAAVAANEQAARVAYDGAGFLDHSPQGSGPYWSGPGSQEGSGG